MTRKLLLPMVLLCLSLVAPYVQPVSADPVKTPEQEWLAQMHQSGWQKVQEGVLQRNTGRGAVETITFGKKGMRWQLPKLEERISFLEYEYTRYPSEDLAKVIARLKGDLEGLRLHLRTGASINHLEAAAGCDFSFGANTTAAPLSGSQGSGVTATATAYFHNNCAKLGNSYAYAYARATSGTTTTTKTQEDPKYNGTWFDSTATASANGTLDCYSESYGRAWSTVMGINYEVSVTNSVCPAAPLAVTISGPTFFNLSTASECMAATWTATASGGISPYTYSWYIGAAYQGAGNTLTKTYCGNNTVTVEARAQDATSTTANKTHTTTWYYEPPCYNPCGCYAPNDPRAPYYCP